MKTKIQISLETLERIVSEIKLQATNNPSLSKTVLIEQVKEVDTYTGEDEIKVWQLNSYAECDETLIYTNEKKCLEQILHFEQYEINITWFTSDKKAVIKYFYWGTKQEITGWDDITPEHQTMIDAIVDSFCSLKGLTKYIY